MSDSSYPTTPEAVALHLTYTIVNKLSSEPATKETFLQTYADCIKTVRNGYVPTQD